MKDTRSSVFALTIVSSEEKLEDRFGVPVLFDRTKHYQARPDSKVAGYTYSSEGYGSEEMVWGIPQPGGIVYSVDSSYLLKKDPWNRMIRTGRCIIPVNAVLVKSERDKPFAVKSIHDDVIGVAAIYKRLKNGVLCFAIIKTESPALLNSYLKDMPALMDPKGAKRWLTTQNMQHVMRGTDEIHRMWLDLIPIQHEVIQDGNYKEWLTPIGPSISNRRKQLRQDEDDRILKDKPKRGK